jgi:type III restriction enzyme
MHHPRAHFAAERSVDPNRRRRVRFVVETKATQFVADLRDSEAAKIACGKAHFSALRIKEQSPEYVVATNLATVLAAANE